MKTWIIVLTIVFIILRIVRTGIANYIKNDSLERLKYYFRDGATTLGVVHGILWVLGVLDLIAVATLILIYIL